MQVNSNVNSQLVDNIVHEVKSQGVFDEFRKDSMADVDTKPAYQNLRQRVENTVKKFLSEQRWTPDINKIQLRERLRKHITDSGFLDVGVERIVDQVVNPKIGTVFQPKIEEIAYKYLGVPKPIKPIETIPMLHQLTQFSVNGSSLKIETSQLLPTDLEQVSPDSDKATVKSESKDESIAMELEEKLDDDDESPPFEPLEQEENKSLVTNELKLIKEEINFPIQSNELENSYEKKTIESAPGAEEKTDVDSETQDTSSVSLKTEEQESDKDINNIPDRFQESQSQLSQVSSDSHLSIATNENNISCCNDNAVNISEEAQMPKFNENSNDEDMTKSDKNKLHFDIKQDEIKFEGTKRISNLQATEPSPLTTDCTNRDIIPDVQDKIKTFANSTELGIFEKKENDSSNSHNFKFSKINVETKDEKIANDTSFSSSLDDSGTAQLCIVDKSENTQISVSNHQQPLTTTQSKESQLISTVSSNIDVNSAEKEYQPCEESIRNVSPSTSSSRHKKHSKQKKEEKDKSHEKERHKDKDKDSDKDKNRNKERHRHSNKKSPSSVSVSRHSSSTSKNHHSSSKLSSNDTKTTVTSSKGESQHKSKHSSSSSSSRSKSRDESSKRNVREGDKKQHSSKDHTSSSMSSRKKKSSQNDDHFASKEKIHWRKSTDSNDEDKRPDGDNGRVSNKVLDANRNITGETRNKYKNGSGTTMTDSSPTSNTAKCTEASFNTTGIKDNDIDNGRSKIVILNDLLENPCTDFIELGTASQERHLHIVSSEEKYEKSVIEDNNNNDQNEGQLCFFEQNKGQFTERLKVLDVAMDSCRKVVNNLRFDSITNSDTEFSNDCVYTSSSITTTCSKQEFSCGTKATLHIDCIQLKKSLHQTDFDEEIEKKRFKYTPRAVTMVSPTSSETSVNSKENEFIAADISAQSIDVAKNSLVEKRGSSSSAFTKLDQQQRYTSDDLYKPRPVLGQRSRRRGLFDTVI